MASDEERTSADADEYKRALRASLRGRRPAWTDEARAVASAAAQSRLIGSGLLENARVVALYQALPLEVETDAIAGALGLAGKIVCYPVVQDGSRALAFRRVSGPLRLGALGVREPDGELVPLSGIDLFVVPALAADRAGRRLGRGRGHYDATLAQAGRGAGRVTLIFDWQLVPEVPVSDHDAHMDAVCTELQLVRCTREEVRT
jgi:5-formyltetrahydrofolate cyclo-ligase